MLEHLNITYCIGRIFSFSGVRQKVPYLVPTLMRKIKELPDGGELNVVNPDSIRDIMDAETIIDVILHLAQKRFKGTINIGSGESISIRDIAHHIAKTIDKEVIITGVNEDQPNSYVADIEQLINIFLKG